MDSSQNDESQEMPTNPSDQSQAEREIDLADEEGFPPNPTNRPEDEPAEQMSRDSQDNEEAGEPRADDAPEVPLAEPGVYVCVHEHAGEHPILGRLDHGQEYDYSEVTDERTLAAVAACVESGLLEKR